YKFIYDKNQTLWMYDGTEGIWEMNVEQKIRTLLRKNLMGDEQQKKNYIEEILAHIVDICYNPNFKPDKYIHLIAFKNKVYNLKTNEYIDFSSELFLTNKLDIIINDDVKDCPLIDKFFADCVGEKYKALLYDLAAYCLYKEVPYQKLFFVFGPGGTGKSQFMNFLEIFLGDNNTCSAEPQHIENDQYTAQQMVGKLANISSDIKYDALNDITQVKKLTGGDTMKIRKMYKNPYNLKIACKQIFSTNKLPIVKEKTRVWYRRVFLLPFENIIEEDKVDRNILKKITSEKELQGFVHMCLKHLRELYENDFVFSYDIDEAKMQKMYEELSNPILMFLNESCVKGVSEYCFKWEFTERLNAWLKQRHFPPYTKSQINQYMKEYYVESNRPTAFGDKTYRVWSGLRWKNIDQSDEFNGFNGFNGVGEKVYVSRKCFQNHTKSVKSVKPSEVSL
ncbi:hypothetical protein LCGC14_1644050, partial [marine sediment metagenome]